MEIEELQKKVTDWAEYTIGEKRNPNRVLVKMLQEVGELFASPDDGLEVADIFILMLDYCHLKEMKIDEIVLEKLSINYKRVWRADPVTGIVSHVRGITNEHED